MAFGAALALSLISAELLSLPVESGLSGRVKFWGRVFSEFHQHEAILHERDSPELIFDIVNVGYLSEIARSPSDLREQREQVLARLTERVNLLIHEFRLRPVVVHSLSPLELSVWKLATNRNVRRARVEMGRRESIDRLKERGRAYLPTIERIFESYGLPPELSRLPFIESGFQERARSPKGALGLWQLMPETAKIDSRVTPYIDERLDWLTSTHTAARYLSRAYRRFQSWPLAVTSYIYGIEGIASELSSTRARSLSELIRRSRNPQFGFATENYYAQLMAMTERHPPGSLKGTYPRSPCRLGWPIRVNDLIADFRLTRTRFREMNPAILDRALAENVSLPAGLLVWSETGRCPRASGSQSLTNNVED